MPSPHPDSLDVRNTVVGVEGAGELHGRLLPALASVLHVQVHLEGARGQRDRVGKPARDK